MIKKVKEKVDMLTIKQGVLISIIIGSTLFIGHSLLSLKDVKVGTVKITNLAQNSGGTGVILTSSKDGSLVLTNKHVCGLLKNGGYIHSNVGLSQPFQYAESDFHDLCLIKTVENLKYNSIVAENAPEMFERARISGHPHLLPNVVTQGHVSDYKTIEVLTDTRDCTEEDWKDKDRALICAFFGKMLITTRYNTRLVSATIMPGSSGSAVYNNNNEIIGLVFAGSGDLSYAFTVPVEYINLFLNKEKLNWKRPQYTSGNESSSKQENEINEMLIRCNNEPSMRSTKYCKIIENGFTF